MLYYSREKTNFLLKIMAGKVKNMVEKLWVILFMILCTGLPYTYYKKGIRTCIAIAYVSGVIIFARLFYLEQGLKAVMSSFVYSAQLFTFGVDGRELVKVVYSVRENLSVFFVACVWACYLICPLLSISVVLTFIKRGLDRTTLRTRFFKDIYIFTERNANSVLLAEDICQHSRRAVVVFSNSDMEDVGLKQICVMYTPFEVFRLLNKTNNIHMCFNDTDTGKLLDKLNVFLSHNLNKPTNIYAFSDSAIAHEVIDGLKSNASDKTVKVISTNAILMRDILWDYPLYTNMQRKDELNVSVLGVGDFGGYFAMNTLWCATMPDCRLKLNLVDMDENENILRRVSENIPDGYFDIQIFNENINTNGFFDKLHETRINESDYILVSMGSDDLNINISRKLRLHFARCGKEPFIITVIKNQSKFDIMKDVLLNEEIIIVGGAENIHSYESIFKDRFFDIAFEVYRIVEKHYGNTATKEDFYKQRQIDIFSSYANAVHTKYKVYSLTKDTNAGCEETKKCLDENIDKIVRCEHDRWVAFEVLKGYTGVNDEDLEEFLENNKSSGKIHKNPKLKMHACITDIDGVSKIDNMIFEKYGIRQNLKEIDELISRETASIWFNRALHKR
jgi:translation initiation factor IF-1